MPDTRHQKGILLGQGGRIEGFRVGQRERVSGERQERQANSSLIQTDDVCAYTLYGLSMR